MRSEDGREQRLGSYELFRRSEPLDAAVWDKLMLGLSARNTQIQWIATTASVSLLTRTYHGCYPCGKVGERIKFVLKK